MSAQPKHLANTAGAFLVPKQHSLGNKQTRRPSHATPKREGRRTKLEHLGATMSETQYELAEISAAKDHAMDAIERELERQGIDPYSERSDQPSPDLIDLADAVVERLIKEGVTVPDTMCDLNGEPAQPGATTGN